MNTLNTTKEEVSAEAILKKKPSINGPGNDVYYEYTDVIEALEEYANTALSSQKGEEAKWISVKEQLPQAKDGKLSPVLGYDGRSRHIVYCFPERFKTVDVDEDEDESNSDLYFDNERGVAWLKAGWYEDCEQIGGTYDYIWVKRKITHWMPLPAIPTL
jgi:hypothetical protein